MHRFAIDLEKSLETGEPFGHMREHYILFKEMPTICFFLKKSFELEEKTIEMQNRLEKNNDKRAKTRKDQSTRLRSNTNRSNSMVPQTFGDIVK